MWADLVGVPNPLALPQASEAGNLSRADLAQRKCNCLGRNNNQTMLSIVKKKTHYRLVSGMSHICLTKGARTIK